MSPFIDNVRITVRSGAGGDGAVSFRREKGVPKGGPDGGRGGSGGRVVVRGNSHLSTLSGFRRKREFTAERGQNGRGKDMYGRKGKDTIIAGPVGTEVWVEESGGPTLVADLTDPEGEYVAVLGGKGGKGNADFVSSTQQAPYIAEKGGRGQEQKILFELKLMADVGVIGKPNAGKSTLLQAATGASPKIANYPFTTLEPQLGVVTLGWESFVLAEVPGLIEGAHQGIGLGHEFLRHATRTRVLIHLVDGNEPDLRAAVNEINEEIRAYGAGLDIKPQILAVNKIDMPEVQCRTEEIERDLKWFDGPLVFLSGAAGVGVEDLMKKAAAAARAARETEKPEARPLAMKVTATEEEKLGVKRVEEGVFRVEHTRAESLVEGSDLGKWAGRAQLKLQLDRLGITTALEEAGIEAGDVVHFGNVELEW